MTALIVLALGCGSSESGFDEVALLEEYNVTGRRHDPVEFVEVEMGEFFITRTIPDSRDMLYVTCHLYAVTLRDEQVDIDQVLRDRQTRMRDTVMSVVQKTDIDALSEPSMAWLKSELVPAINQALLTRGIRDIVFSQFSLQRG